MDALDLIAVGDVSLVCPRGCDPFEHVARYLQAGDIVFGNLECVLCDTGIAAEKEIILCVTPSKVGYLRQAGFGIVNVANNHILDFGLAGLTQTLAVLREQGIRFIGAGDKPSSPEYEIVESKGLRVGFLGYCEAGVSDLPGGAFVNPIDRETILAQLDRLKEQCDIVVVSLHWGFEYVHYPSPSQIELAHELVRAGATLVLGHHPHVAQGIERIGQGLIAYSLGNFQFESPGEQTQGSFILRVRFSSRGIEGYKLIPVQIGPESRPRLVWGGDKREMLRCLERISSPVREGRVTEEWWFEQMAAAYLRTNLRAWVTRMRKYGTRHFMQFVRWLVSGFTIKCFLGLLRRRVRTHE